LLLLASVVANAQEEQGTSVHHHHDMSVDEAGVVMNQNKETLPHGCNAISSDHNLEIHAGRKYVVDTPGMVFAYSDHDINVEPCSRVTITFRNDDDVRHQWMVHGLPRYIYPSGMFHIEANGGRSRTGTFIVPAENKSYLVHCDMAQHMEKGMRGQLIVGSGSGDLWGVNGVSDQFLRASYLPENVATLMFSAIFAGCFLALMIGFRL
jgi:plastocyanin